MLWVIVLELSYLYHAVMCYLLYVHPVNKKCAHSSTGKYQSL